MILDAKTINLEASKLKANQIEITTDILNMVSSKESLYENEFSNKGGMLTATIETKGKIEEIVVPSTIEVNDKLIFNKKDITSQLESDNLVKILSSQGNLTDEQINLVKQIANSKEWHDKTTTLSGMGALIVTAVVTYFTAGAVLGVVGAATGTTVTAASATATQLAISAAIDAVIVQATTSLASSVITGNKLELDLDSIAKSAVTAGVLSYAQGLVKVANLGLGETTQKIAQTVTDATLKTGVQSVVFKTDFKDSLVSNLAMAGTNLAFENVGDYEVDQLKQGNTSWSDGSLNKTITHALVGGTVSAIQNNDILSGVLSAGFREALSLLTANSSEKTQLLSSQLTGIFVGGLVAGEEGANNGYTVATSGEQYNRQLHQDEVKFLQNNIEKFKEYIANQYSFVQGAIISANAEELLTQGAEYLVDENMKNSIDNNTTSRAFPKEQLLQNIKEFLEIQSQGLYFTDTYKESMTPQAYFTATDEQYKDSNWKPDSSIRLEDSSLMFLLSTKIGQTLGTATKEVSPIIIQKSGQVYDDMTLGTINQFNNFAPNLTSKYLGNSTTLTNNTNDFISSALPGIPENNWVGGIGWSAASAYYWEDTIDTVKKDIDLIKSIPTKIEQLIINHQNSQGNSDDE
jgi:filamentous hemagglutinin